MAASNPFAALLGVQEPPANLTKKKPFNTIIEDIFGFTLDPTHSQKRELLLLEEISEHFKSKELHLSFLQHVLFDRLFMCTVQDNDVITKARSTIRSKHATEVNVLTYLSNCFGHLKGEENYLTAEEYNAIQDMIVQNSVTSLIESDIYEAQSVENQLIEVLKENSPSASPFLKALCKCVLSGTDGNEAILKKKLSHLLMILTAEIEKMTLINFDCSVFNVLGVFATEEYLASILLDAKPQKFITGVDYAKTPLGALFNIAILPKSPNGPYDHFQPTDSANIVYMEGVLWGNSQKLTEHLHTLYLSMLTISPQIKNRTLEWLGLCLKSNYDRGKLWSAQSPPELNPATYTTVCDGFMITFGSVMLSLCKPFCRDLNDRKILKVDPTYCGVSDEQHSAKGVHLPGISKETFLIPVDAENNDKQLIAEKYNFVTECFFLAHKAIDLGYRVTVDKLGRIGQEVPRMERAYLDALAQADGNNELVDNLKKRMAQHLAKYITFKAQLSDPILLKLLFDFVASSSYWLSQVAIKTEFDSNASSFAPIEPLNVTFPLPDKIPNTLKSIPEFLVENIVWYLVFLRRFSPKTFEEEGFEKLKPILTFVLIYMGCQERMKNPHLRARLAEALESLLPHNNEEPAGLNTLGGYQREMLFTQHEHRREIVSSLLNVFVGIEMTGQSVAFEQKFNYRRPMYAVMEYLWTKDEMKDNFKLLAQEAEKNMEAVTPPLFLRFINLLMNDAVYLLDEALSNMAKLKEMQQAEQNGEWDNLPPQERAQNQGYMRHIGMIAKFDNILGRDTIKTLEKLTSEINLVFTHPTMVDRVAAMLNYFLYNLVGPKKKNFKVKDQKEYSFDPALTVLNICKIYVNLKDSESFCLAISQDGRSYSPQLFTLAEDVLVRIGGGSLISELKDVADLAAKKALEQKACDEAVSEAPEHFLDPIMSTIMRDPVILPSSKQTVDRTTIARHLLSDQTDPFNRAPLSMDQVIPNTELADEIRRWMEERTN